MALERPLEGRPSTARCGGSSPTTRRSRPRAVADIAFGAPGTARGEPGRASATPRLQTSRGTARGRARAHGRRAHGHDRGRGRRRRVAVGSHQPVGGVTEIVGVGRCPSARRRGLGAAVTAALVAELAAAAPTSCSCRPAATTSRACTGGSASRASARPGSPARPCQAERVTRAVRRPGAVAVAGALTIAFSAILVKLADVQPATAAIFRCAYALPVLGVLAWLEDRRYGRRPLRDRRLAIPAGIFFAADLIFWHHAIADVGAGLATVLGNLQVVVVPFVAWLCSASARGAAARRAAARVQRRRADLRRARDRRLRRPSGARRGVRPRSPASATPASSSCCARPAPTCAARPARCSTRRRSRPSPR